MTDLQTSFKDATDQLAKYLKDSASHPEVIPPDLTTSYRAMLALGANIEAQIPTETTRAARKVQTLKDEIVQLTNDIKTTRDDINKSEQITQPLDTEITELQKTNDELKATVARITNELQSKREDKQKITEEMNTVEEEEKVVEGRIALLAEVQESLRDKWERYQNSP